MYTFKRLGMLSTSIVRLRFSRHTVSLSPSGHEKAAQNVPSTVDLQESTVIEGYAEGSVLKAIFRPGLLAGVRGKADVNPLVDKAFHYL